LRHVEGVKELKILNISLENLHLVGLYCILLCLFSSYTWTVVLLPMHVALDLDEVWSGNVGKKRRRTNFVWGGYR